MKTILRKALPALLLAATALPAFAQKTITFETKDSKSGHHKAFTPGEGKNSLSVGVLSWVGGYVPFYYERSVLSMLSLQVGAGVTFHSMGADLGYEIEGAGEHSAHFNNLSNLYDVPDDYTHYEYRKSKPGLFLSFSPKLYFQNEGMDGLFIAPMISYKMFRYAAQLAEVHGDLIPANGDDRNVPHSSETMDEYVRCLDYSINFGGSYQSRKHVNIGWNAGLGLRQAQGERLDIGYYLDMDNSHYYINEVAQYKKSKLFLALNLTIGGSW